jgi:hypothetical protein
MGRSYVAENIRNWKERGQASFGGVGRLDLLFALSRLKEPTVPLAGNSDDEKRGALIMNERTPKPLVDWWTTVWSWTSRLA